MYRLGKLRQDSAKSARDKLEALEWFGKAAQAGSLEAQFEFGKALVMGDGLKQDIESGLKWLQTAAERGNRQATCFLAICHRRGITGKVDKEKALSMLFEAIKLGEPLALSKQGVIHLQGDGVKEDPEEAFLLFDKAAKFGDVVAQCNLALAYLMGKGVERDLPRAEVYLRAAAARRFECGLSWSAQQPDVRFDHLAAILRHLAQSGHAESQYWMGLLYAEGKGVQRDLSNALECFTIAAAAGHTEAKEELKSLPLNEEIRSRSQITNQAMAKPFRCDKNRYIPKVLLL